MSKGRSSYFDTYMWCCSGGKNRSAKWKDLRPPRWQEGYNDGEQNRTQAHSVHPGAWKHSLLTSRFVCCSHGWWMKRNFFLFLIVSTTDFQVASEEVAFMCNRPFLPMRETAAYWVVLLTLHVCPLGSTSHVNIHFTSVLKTSSKALSEWGLMS